MNGKQSEQAFIYAERQIKRKEHQTFLELKDASIVFIQAMIIHCLVWHGLEYLVSMQMEIFEIQQI